MFKKYILVILLLPFGSKAGSEKIIKLTPNGVCSAICGQANCYGISCPVDQSGSSSGNILDHCKCTECHPD
jgi:hypothetical protein